MNMLVDYAPLLLSRRYLKSRKRKKSMRFKREWQNILVVILMALGALSGIATYAALTEAPPFGNSPNTVIWLLNFDLIILLLLVAVIAHRIVALWSGRKRGLAGSHLQVRLVYTFSILAAAPAIIMTVFSAYFFHFGVQTVEEITPPAGENWMELFVAVDDPAAPAWEGYQYRIRLESEIKQWYVVEKSLGGFQWQGLGKADYELDGRILKLSVPRSLLPGTEKGFRFKWSDNRQTEKAIDWLRHGDAAPNGRFQYEYRY